MQASAESLASGVHRLADTLRTSIGHALVGRGEAVDLILIALLADGHVLIEDLPGTGKTTLCRALAASLQMTFRRIQFTPDLMPSDVVGINVYDRGTQSFSFKPGPVFTNILLADEINRATPRAQSALLEAMQESQVSVDGDTMPLSSPFMVVATQNPLEMEGTFPLPEAQLDRFLIRLSIGLPTREEEARMLTRFRESSDTPVIAPVANAKALAQAQASVRGVAVADVVRGYILDIVAATRRDERLRAGASPRAALALQSASQARAAMTGREFVVPDDVKSVATATLAHRLIVDTSAGLRGLTAQSILADILATVVVPVGD